jgi:hypothetical protein
MTEADIEEQIQRIRRSSAETDKFYAEELKLQAERYKMDRERFWYPVAVASGIATVITLLVNAASKLLL